MQLEKRSQEELGETLEQPPRTTKLRWIEGDERVLVLLGCIDSYCYCLAGIEQVDHLVVNQGELRFFDLFC